MDENDTINDPGNEQEDLEEMESKADARECELVDNLMQA